MPKEKYKMKKLISLFIASALIACMAASCAPQTGETETTTSTSSQAESNSDTESAVSSGDDNAISAVSDAEVKSGGFTQEYEYDADHRIVKISIYSKETNELKAETNNTYNKDGNLESVVLKDKDGNVRVKNKYMYKDDPSGNPYLAEEIYYDASDKKMLSVRYKYSEDNNCAVQDGYYNEEDKKITDKQANEIIESLNAFMYE